MQTQILVVNYLNPTAPQGILQPKKYYFKSDIPNININDIVVVPSKSRKYAFCEVIEILEDEFENAEFANQAKEFVIDLLDLKAHEQRIADKERLQWIQNKLEEKKREFDKNQMYALMAQHDPEAKKLLEEMFTITATIVK